MKTGKYYDGYHKARSWEELCQLQGLPAGFDIPTFTQKWKGIVLGNGVPLSMGRQIARAIKKNLELNHG